ncbi:2-deoxy-D-gluconate 3-dehydrogenase [Pseudooceanicola nanhaiensis]|jgi:NAD(P)-dependent dehydrogenase (short-subunit alcohol dehydrogenase family)|uniref:2-deoxy-D-gluconate 3-dehydrogenase n=1 Tax=Pseudooceanicola nanhaiensis TaxID=375761 RepID=A0A917T3X6_9RHOB|nr:SDR family oxidoreductase [Pseudooceanicola nanhaiensis]GGM10004.1 2-deoxy-D-gluconate 3-dehydrogenase [Pseudooceanicola nanhaiensis]
MDISKLFSLEGRVALITGGSRGLGKHFAEAFIAAGAKVYISSRKADVCFETAEELGPNCIALPADVSTMEGIESLVAQLKEHEDGLDILVNNAGIAWGASFDEFPEKGWDRSMDLNLKAPFFLTQKLRGMLKARASAERPAKVINIASIDGQRLNPWDTYAYHASKAGLIYLTRRVAAELIQDQINVTAIAPGAFASDMNTAARDHGDDVGKRIPNGRIGKPEDIAAAALYLAAPSGDYVVGNTLTVDGGIVNAHLGGSIDK